MIRRAGGLALFAAGTEVAVASEPAAAPTWAIVYAHYKIELMLVLIILSLAVLLARRTWRLKQLAERREADKSRFLAVMSHEIRTPMNAIMTSIELLGRTELDGRQRELMGIAQGAGSSLLQLLDGVLETERLGNAAVQLQSEATDITRLVMEAVDVHRLGAQAKGLDIRVEVASPVDQALWVDGTRLRQVLGNLLSNAVKFTDTGSIRVHLAVEPDGEGTVSLGVSVRDSGIGIAPLRQSALFQPFVQADASTTRHYGGTGLGLAICKQLITLMGGRITLESVEGEGTQVSLHVSQVGTRPLSADEGVRPELLHARPGATVLVVDDMPLNRTVVRLQLEELGYRCLAVGSGEQALQARGAEPWSAVLMDCYLPNMDGYEVVRRWRDREGDAGRRVPIIAISAATDEQHRRRCMDSGFDAVLSKPLDLRELSQCLARLGPTAEGQADPADPRRELWQLFTASCEEDCTQLAAAILAQDRVQSIHHAHRLHGSALVMQQTALARESGAFEQQLRDGLAWEAATRHLGELHERIATLAR
ncbi:ATP-binding protein [Pseudomonas sp. dw_358]|uniref:ATP-binding protein n=1 Tax=Pseudomonas sp. dw_358 TaxID=2720083 RepID=UPI001BD3BC02|nr:ATP-binding protein [Pseudomonas sp. dw_358]